MLEAILEYQKKDAQLVAIEREIADSKAKKVVNQMAEYVKNAQTNLVAIEKNASALIAEYDEVNKKFNKSLAVFEKLNKQKLEALDKDQLAQLEKSANDVVAQMLIVEKSIAALSKKIKDTLTEFESTKQKGIQAKQKHTQGMKAYNELVESKQSEIEKLKKELSALTKTVDKKMLEKYKKMREDKKFPVFVPLLNNSCGGCSMELATSQLNKLEQAGMMECENCRRIIYINKK